MSEINSPGEDSQVNRTNVCHHHEKLARKYLNTVPPRLMSDTVREIKLAFDFFDLNANQSIEMSELRRIFHAINVKKSNDECQEILNLYDLNDDGKIDFHEFIFAVARLIKHDVFTLNDIYQRFNKFDEDQDGKISVSSLPNLVRKGFGISVTDRELFELLSKFDLTDENLLISFEKFLRMIQYAVRQSEQSSQSPDYMRKLNHRCGLAVRHVNSHELKLLKKRLGGYLSSSMDETNQK